LHHLQQFIEIANVNEMLMEYIEWHQLAEGLAGADFKYQNPAPLAGHRIPDILR
jgi:hypothetical protein